MSTEHRELKNHWLAEKSDLQTRLFQVQVLNTQIHGTLKKKEKDHERLQSQLSKLVKDSTRGAPKAVMTISVPLKKAFSQESSSSSGASAQSLLRDAEIGALRNTLTAVSKDNAALRTSIEELQSELVRLRVIEAPQPNAEDDEKTSEPVTSAFSPKTTPVKESSVSAAPAVTPCTPGVRSVRWLIDQTHTAVKQLRDRTDLIATNRLVPSAGGAAASDGQTAQTMASLKQRLTEALRVIEEQDRLIHEALLGKLPGQLHPDARPAEVVWEDAVPTEFGLEEEETAEDAEVRMLTASARKLRRRSLRTSSLTRPESGQLPMSSDSSRRESFSLEDFEAELFPPASPDTLQLLEKGGWQLPRGAFFLPPHAPSMAAQTHRERMSLGGGPQIKGQDAPAPVVLDF